MTMKGIMLQQLQKQITIDKIFAEKKRIAIIRTDYHNEMNTNLEKYARETLIENGVKEANIKTFSVPGSWEIPLMVQRVAETKKFDAIITFGIIIKGDTYHFDMIANEVGQALMQLSLDYSIPVALEILAVYKKEDAEKRAGNNEYNKGIEAATAVLHMLQELKKV